MSERKFTPSRELREMSRFKNVDESDNWQDETGAGIELGREEVEARELLRRKHQEAKAFEELRAWLETYDPLSDYEATGETVPLAERINPILARYGLEDESETFEHWLENYQTRMAAVTSFTDSCQSELEGDSSDYLSQFDRSVCRNLFGFTPEGAIEVEILPTSVFVIFFESKDYDLAFGQVDKKPHETTNGFQRRSVIWGLDVLVEYKGSALNEKVNLGTRRHEEAHAFNSSIFKIYRPEPILNLAFELEFMDDQELLRRRSNIVDKYKTFAFWLLVDELSAAVAGGDFWDYSRYSHLTRSAQERGNYDYYEHPRDGYEKLILKPLAGNHKIDRALKREFIRNLAVDFEIAREQHMQTADDLTEIIGRIMDRTSLDDSELYLWLTIDAAQSQSPAELEMRWRKLKEAVSYFPEKLAA